jgi:hypothetical protein
LRNSLYLLFLSLTAAAASPAYLARVDLGTGQTIEAVAACVPVVADVGDFCLVNATDAQLSALAGLGFRPAVFDLVEADDHYFVRAGAGFDETLLASCCRVLARYPRGYIVAAAKEEVPALNRLPVEIVRISREPMVLSGDDAKMPALPVVDDSLVWLLVNRVSADSVLAGIRRLQRYYTRYSTTESLRRACTWMRSRFASFGCDSTYLDTWSSMYAPNVVGVKTGRVNPDKIYIIDGHVDNTSTPGEPNHCPGADDNASGTTAVIEAARVFADMDFDCTVWFIGFTGEEQGLLGSDDFARRCRTRGDSIRGVLNFDMISYGRQNRDSFEIIGKPSNPNCAWLMDFYIAQADTFSSLKPIRLMDPTAEYSDHASFWQRGYVAFCGIEDDFTPMYHTLGDTIGTLYYVNCGTNNWPMATEAIKAAVASIAKLAGAQPRTGTAEEKPSPAAPMLRVIPGVGRAPVAMEVTGGTRCLDVFDATGSLVRSLPTAGRRAVWDGRSRSGAVARPGVYLVRTGEEVAKVVLTD